MLPFPLLLESHVKGALLLKVSAGSIVEGLLVYNNFTSGDQWLGFANYGVINAISVPFAAFTNTYAIEVIVAVTEAQRPRFEKYVLTSQGSPAWGSPTMLNLARPGCWGFDENGNHVASANYSDHYLIYISNPVSVANSVFMLDLSSRATERVTTAVLVSTRQDQATPMIALAEDSGLPPPGRPAIVFSHPLIASGLGTLIGFQQGV